MKVTPRGWRVAQKWVRHAVLTVSFVFLAYPAAMAQEPLPVLARVGPWPEASNLVGYQGRLWLANSVKWKNHNSADIYAYDPGTGDLRYERHLFSQDAGRPASLDGLLYWPFEDNRFSNGWGQFMVTNGTNWRFRTIPTGQIFHSHALDVMGQRLIAATSAWRAGLDVSDDRGVTWRRIYEHPTPKRRVSRIVDLFVLGDRVIGPLLGPKGRRLIVAQDETVFDLPDWPRNRPLFGAAVFKGWFYALVGGLAGGLADGDAGTSVWRSDGRRSERVAAPRAGWGARGLAAGADGLWATGRGSNGSSPEGGALWFSSDGTNWELKHTLSGGTPREVLVFGGQPYVAGAGDDGRGILWGPPPSQAVAGVAPEEAPMLPVGSGAEIDWAGAETRLDAVLREPDTYVGHSSPLRDIIFELAQAGPPPDLFSSRLLSPVPEMTLSLMGGAVQVSAVTMARWMLLLGMSLTGTGEVPQELITEPWDLPANRAEKYFAAPPAAMWAIAAVGQDDGATIAALIERLERTEDPLWLRGDAVGALSAVTGRRFGYDASAWRKWWSETASR